MHSEIKRSALTDEFFTAERCYITEIANDQDDMQASIARARVRPGVTTAWHKLTRVEERYIIISGSGKVEIGKQEPVIVTCGDVVRIAADTRQRITNIGQDDLIFYAVCTPRFLPECYIALE